MQKASMIGTRIGQWIIEREIGRGGTGTVYRAVAADPRPDAPAVAALKLITHPLTRDPGFLARFPAEMLALRRLTHPNIARLYDAGVHAGLPYYAAEFVDGTDLATLLKNHEKSAAEPGLNWAGVVFRTAIQTARALKHAHHRSLLHRDLKPSNLILAGDGTLKVTDVGVAKVYNLPPLALPAELLGTACYMAPEHFTGKPLTRRSDLYALGGVLYTLVCGRPPFNAATAAEYMHKHCYMLPDRPSGFVPKLPAEFDELICTLLMKDPARRPASAAALLDDLDRIRGKLERKGERILLPPAVDDPTGMHAPLADGIHTEAAEADPANRRAKLKNAALFGGLFLLVVGLILFAFFRPRPAASDLWAKAEPLIASENPDDWERVKDDYLEPLTRWHPEAYVEEVRAARQSIADRKEVRRAAAAAANAKSTSEADRLYRRGLGLAQVGDVVAAKRVWAAVITAFANREGDAHAVALAKQGLTALEALAKPTAEDRRRAGSTVAAVIDETRKLRLAGQGAAADAILAALAELYADWPDELDAIRRAK